MSRADDVINVAAHRLSTGAIEQAIGSHPQVTEVAVVPFPDEMKGHVPFAFLGIEDPPDNLLKDLNNRLREHIGPIAMLGGFISKPGIIPKTRSGKTLRRCLREIVENGLNGEFEKEITVPATVEDPAVVDKAKEAAKVRQFPSLLYIVWLTNYIICRSISPRAKGRSSRPSSDQHVFGIVRMA